MLTTVKTLSLQTLAFWNLSYFYKHIFHALLQNKDVCGDKVPGQKRKDFLEDVNFRILPCMKLQQDQILCERDQVGYCTLAILLNISAALHSFWISETPRSDEASRENAGAVCKGLVDNFFLFKNWFIIEARRLW